jgi:hypothetical protein
LAGRSGLERRGAKGCFQRSGSPPKKNWPKLPLPPELPAPLCSLVPPTSDDDLPGDLQSLSWLTAVDVPRLQQLANGRIDVGRPSVPHPHPGRLEVGQGVSQPPYPPMGLAVDGSLDLTLSFSLGLYFHICKIGATLPLSEGPLLTGHDTSPG